jgi:hypothetical protein
MVPIKINMGITDRLKEAQVVNGVDMNIPSAG